MDKLIIGHQGQLGYALSQHLPNATGVGRADCDVTDREAVAATMKRHSPSLVFNATAYNAVDDAETHYQEALCVNAVAPGRLAAACRDIGARFVHFSTDYVFGDGYSLPIDESATPVPLSAYGRSKLLGERLAFQNNPATIVVRTTGLYSHRRNNFVRTMIKHGLAGTSLNIVSDQFISPTWVEPLAHSVNELADADVCGIYHITSRGSCTWFEFANRIFEILDIKANCHAIDQDSWGAAARRPSFSALDDSLIRALGIGPLKRWDDMLEEFLGRHGADLMTELS